MGGFATRLLGNVSDTARGLRHAQFLPAVGFITLCRRVAGCRCALSQRSGDEANAFLKLTRAQPEFGEHPVHSGNIVYLVGRPVLLASLFSLLAVLLYSKASRSRRSLLSRANLISPTAAPCLSKEPGLCPEDVPHDQLEPASEGGDLVRGPCHVCEEVRLEERVVLLTERRPRCPFTGAGRVRGKVIRGMAIDTEVARTFVCFTSRRRSGSSTRCVTSTDS